MGWGGATALALLAAMPVLAGCAGPPPPPPDAAPLSPFLVRADQLQADRFYAFQHAGGTLAFRIGAGSDTRIDLFDGDDRRVGEYGLGRARAASDLRFEALPTGSYVVRVAALNGTVAIESAGAPVLLWPLQGHVERSVVAQEPRDPVPGIPFVPRDVLEVPVHLNLTRTPTGLRLLSDGGFGDLHLSLEGARGEVFRSDWGGGKFPSPFGAGMTEVPGTFRPERASDERLDGMLVAHDLEGALILEAVSYSRALPPGQDLVGTQAGQPRFTYGLLPPVPVSFEVAPEARKLALWTNMGHGSKTTAPTWVALFDAQDRRIASVPVFPGVVSTVEVAGGGSYVAALLSGNATLGADVAPAGLGLKPLQVLTTELPARPAGSAGDYGQANETIHADGTVFDAQPTLLQDPVDFPPVFTCPADTSVRILHGGETVAAWGPDWTGWPGPAGALLGNGETALWHDGFGETACTRNGVRLLSYQR